MAVKSQSADGSMIELAATSSSPPLEAGVDAGVDESQDWTMDDAFCVLRQALARHYDAADHVSAYLQAIETQILYDNGGKNPSHPNCITAWRQLIGLLEQALGASLRIT